MTADQKRLAVKHRSPGVSARFYRSLIAAVALLLTVAAGLFWGGFGLESPRPSSPANETPLAGWLMPTASHNTFPLSSVFRASLGAVLELPDPRGGWAGGDKRRLLPSGHDGRIWPQQADVQREITPREGASLRKRRGELAPQDRNASSTGPSTKGTARRSEGPSASIFDPRWPSLSAVHFVGAQRDPAAASGIIPGTQGGGAPVWLQGVHFLDDQRGWAVGEEETILATQDGGASWTLQSSGTRVRRLQGIHFLDDQRGWAEGEAGAILATRNGGSSWKRQTSGSRASLLA